jgi:thiol-disulfide isomerase/thioredoxin
MSLRHWLRTAAVAVAAVPLGLLLAGCGSGTDPGQGYVSGEGTVTTVPAGQRPAAPDLRGTTLEGTSFDLAALRGKVVVLNFWASWCPPCRAEGPALQTVARQLRSRGVDFVGVDTRDDDQAAARAFLSDIGSVYPNLDDSDGRVALAFQQGSVRLPPEAIPSTLVVDRAGRVAARILGPTTEPRLTALVTSIATEPA